MSGVMGLRSGHVILTCLSDGLSGYLILSVRYERVVMPKRRALK